MDGPLALFMQKWPLTMLPDKPDRLSLRYLLRKTLLDNFHAPLHLFQ